MKLAKFFFSTDTASEEIPENASNHRMSLAVSLLVSRAFPLLICSDTTLGIYAGIYLYCQQSALVMRSEERTYVLWAVTHFFSKNIFNI